MLTEKYRQFLSKPRPFAHLWTNAIVTGGLIYAGVAWYLVASTGEYNPWYLANQAAAETGLILIIMSFVMSSVVYFWDFADHYLIYRKYWGITGFAFVLVHGLYSLTNYYLAYYQICLQKLAVSAGCSTGEANFNLLYNWPVFGYTVNNFIAFAFGVMGLGIFIIMAGISNTWATRLLGKYWRWFLRLGYLGMFYGALHAGIKRAAVWQDWLVHFDRLPPLSLITVSLVLIAILARVTLQIFLWHKSRTEA